MKVLYRCYFDELNLVVFGWCQNLYWLLVEDGSVLSNSVGLSFLVILGGSHTVRLQVDFT